MKVLELKGINSFYAAQAYYKLMLGLKMLPSYYMEAFEDFYARMDLMPESDQEKMIREAAIFVNLEKSELLDICQFACDPNGIPYREEQLKGMQPEQIHEIIVAVSMSIAKSHNIKLVSETEKKNSKISRLTLDLHS